MVRVPPRTAKRPRSLVVVAALFAIGSALGVWTLVVVPEARTSILSVGLTVLDAAIAWGLLALRAGWRLVAVGVLCLGIAALGLGVGMTLGSGPLVFEFVQPDGDAISDAAIVSVLCAGLAVSAWMVWALTRPATRRAFGSRVRVDAPAT